MMRCFVCKGTTNNWEKETDKWKNEQIVVWEGISERWRRENGWCLEAPSPILQNVMKIDEMLTLAFCLTSRESHKIRLPMVEADFPKKWAEMGDISEPVQIQVIAPNLQYSIFNPQCSKCHLHVAKTAHSIAFCTLFCVARHQTFAEGRRNATCGVRLSHVKEEAFPRVATTLATWCEANGDVLRAVFPH